MPRLTNEADTCRDFVVPALERAGWFDAPSSVEEQYAYTAGKVTVGPRGGKRGERRVADYLLRVGPDTPLALVEAKRAGRPAADGIQQAMEYAEALSLPFAYATNGREIIEHDYLTGYEQEVSAFPSPAELWGRYTEAKGIDEASAVALLTPGRQAPDPLRYYQTAAVQRTFEALARGDRRVLLTLATGTGKTRLAFQLCWRLWRAEWTRTGELRPPRMLYLSDRTVLVSEPYAKEFAPFGDARHRVGESGTIKTSRHMYFSTYQALTEGDPARYRSLPPDFFDLVLVDECHRGSARADSQWREILGHFSPAAQVGMTATPLHEENRDTYAYFGSPLYQYSLRRGIEDGFLAPYRVLRVRTTWDADGWRPDSETVERYRREIPDEDYRTADFERVIALRSRTQAIAGHLVRHLQKTSLFDKTIVFCVSQDHASEMRRAIMQALPPAVMVQHPNYAVRITADEGDRGKEWLSTFSDVTGKLPVVVTTSRLLSTGIDVPMCKNVVIARVVGSAAEFKQIVGRGTRLRTDQGKWSFTVLDYTGSATRHFVDPAFDGYPITSADVVIDKEGEEQPDVTPTDRLPPRDGGEVDERTGPLYVDTPLDGGIADERLMERGDDGRLRTVRLTDTARDRVRTLYVSPERLRAGWPEAVAALGERGIEIEDLLADAGQPDADPFDLLCSLAFDSPVRTRRERAAALRRRRPDFFAKYSESAQAVLNDLLDRYTQYPAGLPFQLPDALKVAGLGDRHGTPAAIARSFGDSDALREAVAELERLLYSTDD